MNVENNVVYLYSTSNPVVLHLIRIKLSEAGIISKVYDESISNVYHLQALNSRIMVLEKDLAEAREIIVELESSLQRQETEFDFKDADAEDIEFEKAVHADEERLKTASPRNLILILIIALIVLIMKLLAFI